MTDNNHQINQLLQKLETLLIKQDQFSNEINNLRAEINQLKTVASGSTQTDKTENKPKAEKKLEVKKEILSDHNIKHQQPTQQIAPKPTHATNNNTLPSNLEKFIGENLINKIGIAITVIGVGIGAKYSIENELISPLTRIILGYITGLLLLAFGIKLKAKYENYSAVLVSGAVAIMYFITFAGYSFYNLIPQNVAFVLMVVFTMFTVIAAINYNKQIIAHIGLVGAYAVPFLLSDGSGNTVILFSYMAIINIGILAIAFKKYWKSLYYVAFGLTWLIYFMWYISKYSADEHYRVALTFLSIFFATFYATFLAYKLVKKDKYEIDDTILILANAFVFYGLGYTTLDNHEIGGQLLGLFTASNALIHFMVSVVIYRQKLADKGLFYLVSGLVLLFITIAIPVQLDGNWVTLLWAIQAALLFWVGRTKNIPVYEKLAYPLMILAFFSIIQDWFIVYDGYNPEYPETRLTPLLNINFMTSVLFIAAFGFINTVNRNKKYVLVLDSQNALAKLMNLVIPGIWLFILYYAFRMEIANYWNQLYADSTLTTVTEVQQYFYRNYDLSRFKKIWIINYSLAFLSVLAMVNIKILKNRSLGMINIAFFALTLVVFLVQGLYILSELRESYLDQSLAEYYQIGIFNILIRYLSLAIVAIALVICFKTMRQKFIQRDFSLAFNLLLHTAVLWMASSELIHWMDIADSSQSYKLGLSILWGMYALFLIALGIWKINKPVRIGAIVLFGITLLKLFFYDITHLDTIAKTIVFVSLGILLLIISFLYNKYKHIIADESEN